MTRYQEPQPGIITLSLLDAVESADVLADLKAKHEWAPATVSGAATKAHHAPKVRSATVSSLEPNSETSLLFRGRVHSIIRPLIRQRWNRDIIHHSRIQLVKYVPGDFYKAHRDSGRKFDNRYFTVVCYLNDGFKGGGTYFPSSDYTVVPEAGKAVVFPSDYLHRADELIEGTKYIAVVWMLDSPPPKWI